MKRAPPETDGARNWIQKKTEPQSLSSSFDRRLQPATQLPPISWRLVGDVAASVISRIWPDEVGDG